MFVLIAAVALVVGGCSSNGDDGEGSAAEVSTDGGTEPESTEPDDATDTTEEDETGGEGDEDDPDADSGDDDGETTGTDAGTEGDGDSGDGDSPGDQYADALLGQFKTDQTFPGADYECLASTLTDAVGADQLAAAGVTPQQWAEDGPEAVELTRAQAEALVNGFRACGMTTDMWYTLMAGQDVTDELVDCMAANLPEDDLYAAMVEEFLGGPSLYDAVGEQLAPCAP